MQSKILKLLKQAGGVISGQELSRQLHITRSAIWKHIRELRRLGYEIDASTHVGYQLKKIPDKLLISELQDGLNTRCIGQSMRHYDSVDSTMNIAFMEGSSGTAEGFVAIAETQTQGRGRLGKSWVSPRGKGVYLSMLLRPQMATTDIAKITLLSGVVICEAIQKISGVNATIKWPNDVLVDNKKVAGCLTEINAEMDRVNFIVVGVGININTSQKQLQPGATSLKIESGRLVNRIEFVKALLRTFEQRYQLMQEEGFALILERWKSLSSTIGANVCVNDHGKSVEGRAVDLDEFGGLIIVTEDGDIVHRMSGDVQMV